MKQAREGRLEATHPFESLSRADYPTVQVAKRQLERSGQADYPTVQVARMPAVKPSAGGSPRAGRQVATRQLERSGRTDYPSAARLRPAALGRWPKT